MRAGKWWLAAIALGALLVWGLAEVVLAPLSSGELYPAYSSLRSDPLGARALFESLQELPGLRVARLYKRRETIHDPESALFVLGVDPSAWLAVKSPTLEVYEKLVRDGGRLVIGFLPVRLTAPASASFAVEERWGLRVKRVHWATSAAASAVLQRGAAFTLEAGDAWTVLAGSAKFATALERPFGSGSVVLLTAPFPLSNEGLRSERQPELIAKLVGPARHIWFDEEHFGVAETGSVGTLIRKFGLEGAVAVLLLTGALFLWRSTTSFLPARGVVKDAVAGGRDSMEGLASLLRRGIPRKGLVVACREEFRKSAGREPRAAMVDEELKRLEKARPLEAYRAARRVLITEKQ